MIFCVEDLEKLVALLVKEDYEMGEVICMQGNVGDNFYIIATGEVIVRRVSNGVDEKLATLKNGDYFGEQALLRDDVRQATCSAGTKVSCLTLGRDDFIGLMGTVEDVLADEQLRVADRLASSGSNPSIESIQPGSPSVPRGLGGSESTGAVGSGSAPQSPDGKVGVVDDTVSAPIVQYTLSDFTLGRVLGRGAFGTVKLCKLIATGVSYAIKCQGKAQIVKNNLQGHILSEVKLMNLVQHPFVVELVCTMQDSHYVYFVCELLQGGELFTYLRTVRRLQEPAARFYSASVVNAFEALHKKSIAYRDLKPENLVILYIRCFVHLCVLELIF